jgi:hypothetical protein
MAPPNLFIRLRQSLEQALAKAALEHLPQELAIADRVLLLTPQEPHMLLSCRVAVRDRFDEATMLQICELALVNHRFYTSRLVACEATGSLTLLERLREPTLEALIRSCAALMHQADTWERLLGVEDARSPRGLPTNLGEAA